MKMKKMVKKNFFLTLLNYVRSYSRSKCIRNHIIKKRAHLCFAVLFLKWMLAFFKWIMLKREQSIFKHPLEYNMGHRFILRVIIYKACISYHYFSCMFFIE